MDKNFYGIFKTFFKVGTLLLGGGYVILPLLTSELVEKKKWISSDELVEYYALSTSLPGVIAVNTAIFTGNKLLGTKGAIAAICGMILPAFLTIILIASILQDITKFNFIQNAFWGIGIGVITLLYLAIKEMWKKSVNDIFSASIFILSLGLALFTRISLAIIVIFSICTGIFYQLWNDKHKKES